MGALFVHDHKFRKIDGQIYSPGGLSNEILTRYTDYFGKITVIARIREETQAKANYSKITNENVTIHTNQMLKQAVQTATAVVVRLPSINGYRAIGLARKYRKPYLVEVVGCTWDAYWNYSLKGKLAALPAYCIMRHCVKHAPYAVYVTKQFLQSRYPCKGRTEAVSDVALQRADAQILSRRLEGAKTSQEKIILGTAAAVDVEYKGQEYVIRALPLLMEKLNMPVEYQLVGGGDPTRLKDIAQQCGVAQHLVCKGTLPHEQVFSWLDEIDVYLQPSLLEGLSRALIEAMSRALPCIATDCGGNPELLEKRWLVSAKPLTAMPQVICNCVLDLLKSEIREQQTKRNYAVVTEQYNNDRLCAARNAFYKEFAAFAGVECTGR